MSRHIGLPSVGLSPPVRDAGAADERDAAVDDEQLAVRPVVQACEPVPANPLVALDAAARLAQRSAPLRNAPKLPIASMHDRDAHAGPCRARERVDERLPISPCLKM